MRAVIEEHKTSQNTMYTWMWETSRIIINNIIVKDHHDTRCGLTVAINIITHHGLWQD
jgi:serine protease inhibitor